MEGHTFLHQAARLFNSEQTSSVLMYGNLNDLYVLNDKGETKLVPFIKYLFGSWNISNVIRMVYELNGPVRLENPEDQKTLAKAWGRWRTAIGDHSAFISPSGKKSPTFEDFLIDCIGKPTYAFELLRQLTLMSRDCDRLNIDKGFQSLVIVIESADMFVPAGNGGISGLSMDDRRRVGILHDWVSDQDFNDSKDCLMLLSESPQLLHSKVTHLPQLLKVEVPAPDDSLRKVAFDLFNSKLEKGKELKLWSSEESFINATAGLSLRAMQQLLKEALYSGGDISFSMVNDKVESYIQSQLGEDVVEFKKPKHRIKDLVGNEQLKCFIKERLIPRIQANNKKVNLPGFAVAGAIRGGKTYIFEAVAAELNIPVLVLKNFRSQWFGQTDVLIERLIRVLHSIGKVLIFVDEADTQFGGVGADVHETEKRLTGRFQQLMSDSNFLGRIVWVLLTARIHLLSPDMRGPGRAGGLIIPVLDPRGDDLEDYLKWLVQPVMGDNPPQSMIDTLMKEVPDSMKYAGSFMALRSELESERIFANKEKLNEQEVMEIIKGYNPPPIENTREYQALQALLNCTRRDFITEDWLQGSSIDDKKDEWNRRIKELESQGIR